MKLENKLTCQVHVEMSNLVHYLYFMPLPLSLDWKSIILELVIGMLVELLKYWQNNIKIDLK